MKTTKWLALGLMACVGAILFASCGTCEHTYSEWETKVAPTCTAFGYDTRVCSECGEEETRINENTEHTYGEWETKVAPTCTAFGYDTRVCSEYGEEETKIVEAVGHSYANNQQDVVLRETTCVDDGLTLKSCLNCGEQELQISPKTGVHIYEEGVCKYCELPQSQGLVYEMDDGVYYVTGIGTCTDSHIYIPRTYKGILVEDIDIENEENTGHVTDITLHKNMSMYSFGGATGLPNLQNIYVSEENENLISENGIVYTRDKKTLIKYPDGRSGVFVVPDDVQDLHYGAFAGSKVTRVELPDSITRISHYSFDNCDSLTSVVIGKGVTSIAYDAFRDCDSLTSVYYKGTTEEWGNIDIENNNNELLSATVYYYKENEANVPTDGGKYWHYVDGVPTVWGE